MHLRSSSKKTLVPPTLNVVRLYSTLSVLFRIKKAIPQTAERKVTKKIYIFFERKQKVQNTRQDDGNGNQKNGHHEEKMKTFTEHMAIKKNLYPLSKHICTPCRFFNLTIKERWMWANKQVVAAVESAVFQMAPNKKRKNLRWVWEIPLPY